MITDQTNIKDKIHNVGGLQVMLDSDIAELFGVETKRLNEQMKRNIGKFPKDFCFKLNSKEFKNLRSQIATFDVGYSSRKYLPYAYTEHGIIALSNVLKSDVAIQMSVSIVRAFVAMRKFINENGEVLLKLAQLQNRQIGFEIEANKRFDEVLQLIDRKDLPKQAIFFESQYGNIEVIERNNFHDRFLIIDNKECYSLGASLNYAGKKMFTVCKIDNSDVIEAIINIAK